MAAPLSGDGPLPGAVFTNDAPSPKNIGFNETGDQPPQHDTPPPMPSQSPGVSKPQIEVNSTIQIVLISLGIVVALLFLFGILAAYYIAHKNKKARQHQEALDREEEQRRQRQSALQKKHIAINTILDRKGNLPSADNDNSSKGNNDNKGDATGDRKLAFGGSLHLRSSSDAVLDNTAGYESETALPCNGGNNSTQSNPGAGPRRESFLTLSPDGFGITLWPDTSTPSLGSVKGGQSSGVESGTTEAALYAKEFGSQSQQGGRSGRINNSHNINSSTSHSTNRTALNTQSSSSSTTAGHCHRGTPYPPGTTQGVPSQHSVGAINNGYHAKVGQNPKNSFTEVAQIYAHRQSLVDPLGLQTLAAVAAVSTVVAPSSSGDRSSPFPSSTPPLASSPPPPLSSHSLSTSDWQQSLSTASQFHDPLTFSKDTSIATLSKQNEDFDTSNTNETSTVYETAISIPSEMYDQLPKGNEEEDDDYEDSGAGVGTVKAFNNDGGYEQHQHQQQQQPQHQQDTKPAQEPEEVIVYPKIVPRRKKSSNAFHQIHHEQQQPQQQRPMTVYRQSIIVPNMASSVEISYQPPSQPTSPTSETFDRSLRKAGLSHRGHQESNVSGGGGVGIGGVGGRGLGAGVGKGLDTAASSVVINVGQDDEGEGENEEMLVMPQVVPRRPRTATFPHRPINYRHSQVYMHHESRPSLNISMSRRSMYGFGDLMGPSSSSSPSFDPSSFQRSQSPPSLQPQMSAPARPDPFTVSRSKTVYDATKNQAPSVPGRLQTTSSVSATTQRLRRKWAGGEIAIETTVPTHSGIGSSVGSIHSMRRNERSFADEDYDEHMGTGPSFPRSQRTPRRTSFERYNGSGAGVGMSGGSSIGGGGVGGMGGGDPESVVVSLPSPRGCLLEDDQHNAEKQFYEMMNFLGGGPSGGNGGGGGGGGGHARQQSYRNPYQTQPFPQHHQRLQTYNTPSKRQSYYPPSQYQQQKQTYSYERTSFDRNFQQPVQQSVYQNTQSHRMSYAEDYYRAQQHQHQQQQQQQPSSSTKRDPGRRAQNALKRLSGIFGGGGGNSSSSANEDAGGSSAAGMISSTGGRGVGMHGSGDEQPRYREGGQRRRGPMTAEEKIKRHSIAVMNEQMFFGLANQQENFYANAERFERQESYPPPTHQHHMQQQQQRQMSSSSSMSQRPRNQLQQPSHHQGHYRQGSSFSSRNNSYRNDKNRRATMYGAISSMSGRYSSDLIRQADFYVESPVEELDGFNIGVGVGGGVGAGVGGGDEAVYDHEAEGEEEVDEDHEEGEEEDEYVQEEDDHDGHGEDVQEEEEGEEGEEVDEGGVYYEAEEDAELEREERVDGGAEDDIAMDTHNYPEMEYGHNDEYGGFTRPKPLKQVLIVPSGGGGNRPRRAQSSHGESVTVGALSSSSALDEDGVKAVKQPLKKIMRMFK
ncbi:hypothetical protein BGZ73_004063 [Actinomortierella ambigua]|nr:hypothetical protein BGZ73_004063 [Actinomortierella ambigua]